MSLEERLREEWEKHPEPVPGKKFFETANLADGPQYRFGLELLNGWRFAAGIPAEWFSLHGEVTDDRITSGIRMALEGLTDQIARQRIKEGAAKPE